MPLALNTQVKSPYGVGVLTAYREEDQIYTITLTQWILSDGQKVHIYSQESQFTVIADEKAVEAVPEVAVAAEAVVAPVEAPAAAVVEKKVAKFEVGAAVKTDYGVGVIKEIRADDNMFHIELTNWILSEGQKVHIFAQQSQLTLIEADAATTATITTTTTTTTTEVVAAVEEEKKVVTCSTPYGRGEIVAHREEDGIYTVRLTNWVLTDNQPVHIYCTESGFTLDASEQEAANKVAAEKKKTAASGKKEGGCCTIM